MNDLVRRLRNPDPDQPGMRELTEHLAAAIIERYEKETGGLLDTHPGLVAKALDVIRSDSSTLYEEASFTNDEFNALRAAKFEAPT